MCNFELYVEGLSRMQAEFTSMPGHQRPSQGSYSKARCEEKETKDSTFLRKGCFTCVPIFTSIKKSQDLRYSSCLLQGASCRFCSLFYSQDCPVFPTVPKVLLRDYTWCKYP